MMSSGPYIVDIEVPSLKIKELAESRKKKLLIW